MNFESYTMKSVFIWVVTSIIHDEVILHSAFETEKEALVYAGKSGDGWHNVKKVYLKTEQVPIQTGQ